MMLGVAMATTRQARNRATANYIRNHTRRFVLQCHNEKDADVIAYLEAYPGSVNALLKQLIRERINIEYEG